MASLPDTPPAGQSAAHASEALERAWERARAAWPAIGLSREAFFAHLGAVVPAARGGGDPFGDVHVADLYLACACGHEDPAAIRALEGEHLSQVPRFVAKTRADRAFAEEVAQALRCRLLLRDGGEPKILEYAGRGSLGAWVRAAAIRTAQSMLRQKAPLAPLAEEDELRVSTDRELAMLREELGPRVAAAFREALRGLSAEQRNLLRLHYIDGLSFERIGALFRVNRATACRRVAEVRRAILTETRSKLRAELHLKESEIDALTRLLRSQLDVSVSSLLAAP